MRSRQWQEQRAARHGEREARLREARDEGMLRAHGRSYGGATFGLTNRPCEKVQVKPR